MSLLNSAGKTVATRAANALGGAAVPQRARRAAATACVPRRRDGIGPADRAHDAVGAAEHRRLQPDDPVQRLRLPDHPRRHASCLLYVHPPQDVTNGAARRPAAARSRRGPDADPDRVLGLRLRRPGRPAERDRDPRQPDGLHGRRRQHARHRLLGRRLRLLRAAAEPRRLRRDRDDRAAAVGAPQQGRDDGHLLRRDQPAVHRPDQAAEPGRDLAALGDRQHADDALPGRHPEHGVRGRLGPGADPRRHAGVADRRAALGLQADPGGRRDLQGQPGRSTPRRWT